jgi:predicted transposase YdaD
MDTLLTTTEKEQTLPYVLQLYKEGLEKGLEKGSEKGKNEGMVITISNFMRKNPSLTNEQIADMFDISVDKVREMREKLK